MKLTDTDKIITIAINDGLIRCGYSFCRFYHRNINQDVFISYKSDTQNQTYINLISETNVYEIDDDSVVLFVKDLIKAKKIFDDFFCLISILEENHLIIKIKDHSVKGGAFFLNTEDEIDKQVNPYRYNYRISAGGNTDLSMNYFDYDKNPDYPTLFERSIHPSHYLSDFIKKYKTSRELASISSTRIGYAGIFSALIMALFSVFYPITQSSKKETELLLNYESVITRLDVITLKLKSIEDNSDELKNLRSDILELKKDAMNGLE